MAELVPVPLTHHLDRIPLEWRRCRAIFDLPERSFWFPDPRCDLSVVFHGDRAASPAGPAAGPQSQMAQNIVLCWLAGARIIELKTVQIQDKLEIPRPCIDARNVGYNVEWSQELLLVDSLSEYVNAWVLIAWMRAMDLPGAAMAGAHGDTLFDLSVGYDLKGISSSPIRRYLESLLDASAQIDARRSLLPAGFRDIEIDPVIAKSVTLSTFHGCPADEIEKIAEFLLRDVGVHTIVKMNPTLLGYERVEHLLRKVMGYDQIRLDPKAFEHDLKFPEAIEMVGRLQTLARQRNLGFGVKFSNTLVVENHDDYFKDEVMYLSGQPLHVLAATLALEFREAAGADIPISFSAGIDQNNFADAAAMGFVPITSCTDLLRPGGYGRMARYLRALETAMTRAGAKTLEDWIRGAQGRDDATDPTRSTASLALENSRKIVARLQRDPRYHHPRNRAVPKKIGSKLSLFDCISCDKCVPVCPNDANFVYETPPRTLNLDELHLTEGVLRLQIGQAVATARSHQIGNYADFCNECGNCDVFCPEDGGPFIEKPRFFGSLDRWRADAGTQAFYLERDGEKTRLHGRLAGRSYLLEVADGASTATFTDGVLCATLTRRTGAFRSAEALPGAPQNHVLPLGPGREMLALLAGVTDRRWPTAVNTWLP